MTTRDNPVLGQDLVSVGWKALGLAGSGALADKFVWPAVKNVVPGQGAVSQMAHGATTFVTAVLLGKGVSMMGQRTIGHDLTEGGVILGIGEVIASVLPGFAVSGSFPTALAFEAPVRLAPGPATPASNAPALPAATGRVFSGV